MAVEMKGLLKATTLEVAQTFVDDDPRIRGVSLRAYVYKPNNTTPAYDRVRLTRDELLHRSAKIDDFLGKHEGDWNCSVESRVIFENKGGENEFGHFPMMDMAPMRSPEGQKLVERRLTEVVVPDFGGGVLLGTRRSYHFFGNRIFPENRYDTFLGQCLLSANVEVTPPELPNIHTQVADYRFIGHALKQGPAVGTALRITANNTKTVLPRVVSVIG